MMKSFVQKTFSALTNPRYPKGNTRHRKGNKVGMLEIHDFLIEKLFVETETPETLSYFWLGPNSCQKTSLGTLKTTGEKVHLKVEFDASEIVITISDVPDGTVLAKVTDKRKNSYLLCAITWSEALLYQLDENPLQ